MYMTLRGYLQYNYESVKESFVRGKVRGKYSVYIYCGITYIPRFDLERRTDIRTRLSRYAAVGKNAIVISDGNEGCKSRRDTHRQIALSLSEETH